MRYGVRDSSVLGSQRIFQNTSLPLKNARCTPASRAASTAARCGPDQYSSWPTERKTLWFLISAPRRSPSSPVVYATSYPFASSHRIIGYSALKGMFTAR